MAENDLKIQSKSDALKEKGEQEVWLQELQAAEKFQDKWKRGARRVVKAFRASNQDAGTSPYDENMQRKFNLFSANVQIMQSALLNQIPTPVATREFKDAADDVARVAGLIIERALQGHNNRNFNSYNILCSVIQDNLVPGLGCSWHTYDAKITEVEEPPTAEMLAADPTAQPMKVQEVTDEKVVDEYVYWEDLYWSPCRVTGEIRWLGRAVYMTRDQLRKRFGKAKGDKIPLDRAPLKNDNTQLTARNMVFEQAAIFEIWDKESKTVYWISKGVDFILDKKPDFLRLRDFFPCPLPLFATLSNGKLLPLPDYDFVKDQYRELNEINTRISLLVRACRVAGVYDKSCAAVPSLINNAAENVIVPVDQWAMLAEKNGLKGVMDFLPLEQIVRALEQLLKAREDVKAQIYEVTGMSDIIRGASKASETLGAQKIKAQYASMRIQTRQKAVATYASQVFDIQAQILRGHVDSQEIARLAQVQFMEENPQLIEQALQLLKTPEFQLRVQVESDTLSDIDFQAERDSRMEYMTVITNFLKENGQVMTQDPRVGPFLMQLLQFALAGFRVGRKFEGKLDQMIQMVTKQLQQPKPPQPTPEEKKVDAEIKLMQEEAKFDQQSRQMELGFKEQEGQLKLRAAQQDAALNDKKFQQKMQQDNIKFAQQIRQRQIEAAMPQAPAPRTVQ